MAVSMLPLVASFIPQVSMYSSVGIRVLRAPSTSPSAIKRVSCGVIMQDEASKVTRRSLIFTAGVWFGAKALKIDQASAQDLSGLRKMITGGGEAKNSDDGNPQGSKSPFCEVYQCADASQETLGGQLKPFQFGYFSMLAPANGWTSEVVAVDGQERFAWNDGKGGRVAVSAAPAGALAFRVPSPTAGGVFGKAVVSNDLARVGIALGRARDAEYTGGRARLVEPGGAIVYNIGLKTVADRQLLAVAAPAPPLRGSAAAAAAPPPASVEVWTVSCAAPLGDFPAYKSVFGEILQSVALQPAPLP